VNFKVDFMFYTNFGYSKDKKSNVAYYTVKTAERRGMVNRIISIGYTSTRGLNKKYFVRGVPGGNFTARGMYLISKFYKKFKARQWIEHLLDTFGSKYIEGDVFYSWPRLVNSLNKAGERHALTVVYGTSAHPWEYIKLMSLESGNYGTEFNNSFEVNIKKHIKSLEKADYILALSNYAKETYVRYGISEEKIIGPIGVGIDISRFKKQLDSEHDSFNVLFVADMTPLKGVLYLLKAWSELKLRESKLFLVGLVRDSVKRVVEEYTRRDSTVIVTGSVSNPKPYYDKASVFVMPSLCEGFEKVTLEAMASGLPVIATTNTGARDIVKDGEHGFIVPIRDSKAIRDKIQYFYDNPSEVKRMGKNARKVAEKYTWDMYSERIANALEKAYEMWR